MSSSPLGTLCWIKCSDRKRKRRPQFLVALRELRRILLELLLCTIHRLFNQTLYCMHWSSFALQWPPLLCPRASAR